MLTASWVECFVSVHEALLSALNKWGLIAQACPLRQDREIATGGSVSGRPQLYGEFEPHKHEIFS